MAATQHISPFQFEAFPCFAVDGKDRGNRAFNISMVTCSDKDLVEEFLACRVWLLSRRWSVRAVTRRDFDGFNKQILSPAFIVELGDRSHDLFVMETEMEVEDLVGLVTKTKIEKGASLRKGHVRLNHVFSLTGLEYEDHKARPKRGKKMPIAPRPIIDID